MRFIFPFLLLVGSLLQAYDARSVVTFTPEELQRVEKRLGSAVRHRIEDFSAQLERFRNLKPQRRLVEVNTYVNGYLPEYDSVVNRREDYWSTPKEFLAAGYGDCEEYAITKYFVLMALGFAPESLCLSVVRDLYSGGYHMVLAYYPKPEASPLILDNLSFRILPLARRSDLQPQYCFNAAGTFALDANGRRQPLQRREAKFDDLMKRIESGR